MLDQTIAWDKLVLLKVGSNEFVNVNHIARFDGVVGEWDNYGEHVRLWLLDGTLVRVFEPYVGRVWAWVDRASLMVNDDGTPNRKMIDTGGR